MLYVHLPVKINILGRVVQVKYGINYQEFDPEPKFCTTEPNIYNV
jgi:hypothetical protein